MINHFEIRFKEIQKYLFGERGIIIALAIFFGCCIYLFIVEYYTTEFSISKYINLSKDTINFHSGTENSGIYFSIGKAFEQTNDHIKNISSSGGYENASKVLSDNIENSFGLVQEEAYLKDNIIRTYLNYVIPLYLERMHVFCKIDSLKLKLSSYNSPELLQTLSKTKINVGPIGSGTNILSGYIIDELNKQIELINSNLLGNNTSINYIGDSLTNFNFALAFEKKIPIILTIAGAPFEKAIDVLNSGHYELVSIDPLFVDKINQRRKLGLRSVTFEGKYQEGKRINTFATATFLITRKSTNPSMIKKVLDVFNTEKFKQTFYNDIGLISIEGDSLIRFPQNIVISDLDSFSLKPNSNIRCLSININDTIPFKIERLEDEISYDKIYCYAPKDTIKLGITNKLIEVQPHFKDIHFTDIYSKQFNAESNLILRNLLVFFFSLITISFGMFVLITNFLSAVKYHKFFNEITNIVRINIPDNALLNKDSIVRMTETELNEFEPGEKETLISRLNKSLIDSTDDGKKNSNKLDYNYKTMFIKFIDNIKYQNKGEQSETILRVNKIANRLKKIQALLSLFLTVCLFLVILTFITQIEFFHNQSLTFLIGIIAGISLYFIINKFKIKIMNKRFGLYRDALPKKTINKSDSGQNSDTIKVEYPYLKNDQTKLINRINQGISRILLIKMDIAHDYSDGGLKEKDYVFLMKNCNEVMLLLKKSLGVRLLHCCRKIEQTEMKKCLEIFQTAEYLDKEEYDNIIRKIQSD